MLMAIAWRRRLLHNVLVVIMESEIAGFLKLISPKDKASKILLWPIKLTNLSVRMVYKGQSSFGITAILYTYRAYKILFRPIKCTKPLVRMAYKDQSS